MMILDDLFFYADSNFFKLLTIFDIEFILNPQFLSLSKNDD